MGATKTYRFKAQISEIEPYPLCLGNISKDFRTNNMKQKKNKKKQQLNRYVYYFSVDYNIIDTSNIIDIRK